MPPPCCSTATAPTSSACLPVFDNAGIAARHSCVPLEWYLEPHGWVERSRLFREHAVELLTQATLTCLERAGLALERYRRGRRRLHDRRHDPQPRRADRRAAEAGAGVRRLPIFGLGCAGGVIGLSRAVDLARRIRARACSISSSSSAPSPSAMATIRKSNVVAAALFGDGAAAALISTEGERSRLRRGGRAHLSQFPGCHGLAGQGGRARRSLLARHSHPGADRVQGGAGGFPDRFGLRAPISPAPSAIPAGPRSSMRWRRASSLPRAP